LLSSRVKNGRNLQCKWEGGARRQIERDKGSRRGGVYKSAGRKGKEGRSTIVSVTFIAPQYKDLSLIG